VDVEYASWHWWESRPDVLLYSAHVLLINVKRSQLDINQGGLNLRVTHELHERGQTHTGPDHVGSECVAEPMRVGMDDTGGDAVMTEE
jgi:hypothetical protein